MRIELAIAAGAPDGFRIFVEVPDGATEFTIPTAMVAGTSVAGTAPAADTPIVSTTAAAPITHDESTVDISATGPQPDPVTGAFDTSGTTAQTVNTPVGSSATPPGAAVAGTNDTSQHTDIFQGDPDAPPAQSTDADTVAAPGSVAEAQANAPAADEEVPAGDQAGSPAGDQPVTEPLPPAGAEPTSTPATPAQIRQALVELTGDADGELTTEELNDYLTARGLPAVTEDEHAAVAEPAVEG